MVRIKLHITIIYPVVTLLDQHSPDILLLTETPLQVYSGPLTHALRNRGCKIHHNPSNSPSQPDVLLEARLPYHLIHSGGGCWLA